MIQITHIDKSDKEAWLVLWYAYIEYYKGDVPQDIIDYTWARFFIENDPIFCLGAYENGELIGIAHYVMHPGT